MYIIVKQLQAAASLNDLERFVSPALKGSMLQKAAALKALKIVALVDKDGKILERHGLIRVAPESEKKRIIKVLNGKTLLASPCEVCEFSIRHWSNDRRGQSLLHGEYPQNRRKGDRRRKGLRTFTLKEKVD